MKEDQEILQQFSTDTGQVKAFEWLLEKYQKPVYWHVRRILISHDDADDVTQNTFIKIWKSLSQFKQESKLYTWIYRIATNESINFINQRKQHQSLEFIESEMLNHLTASNYFDGNDIQRKLQEAILTLPEKQRLVFNLKYFENMKYEEMSEVLETSVGALKASYHLAVKKLSHLFTNEAALKK